VIALVTGDLSGQGRIAWAGRGEVKSTGEFTVRDTDLAASFGPVTGLNTTVRFTDLLGLETAPGQIATVKTINPGILVENGVVRYSLLPGRLVRVERGEWPFMGGRLILQETILNFNLTIRGPFRALIATAKSFRDPTDVISGALPRPLKDIPGITLDVRRIEEQQNQTQTPVKEQVTIGATPEPPTPK
jgi:hypothetical protein